MKTARLLAKLWLGGFFVGAFALAHLKSGVVEAHDLSRALTWGFDAFGRDCLGLTFVAAWRSFTTLLPLSLGLIVFSLMVALMRFLTGNRGELFFRSALDTVSSLPGLLVALALSAFFEEQRWGFLLACVLSVVPYLIRFYEGQVTELRARPYYLSTIALGATPAHLYFRYVGPELVIATSSIFPFLMTRLILIETSLSFLGLESFSKNETWGRLLYQGKDYLLEAPWIIASVGTPLFLTLLAFHLLSDPERT